MCCYRGQIVGSHFLKNSELQKVLDSACESVLNFVSEILKGGLQPSTHCGPTTMS